MGLGRAPESAKCPRRVWRGWAEFTSDAAVPSHQSCVPVACAARLGTWMLCQDPGAGSSCSNSCKGRRPGLPCLFIAYLWRRKNKGPVALATRSIMGCFLCDGKMAKSPCGGHPRMCVYPDRGWGWAFQGPSHAGLLAACRLGEGTRQALGKSGWVQGPCTAESSSGLLASVLTPVLWCPPCCLRPSWEPFPGHALALRTCSSVNGRCSSQTRALWGYDVAESQALRKGLINSEWMNEWSALHFTLHVLTWYA